MVSRPLPAKCQPKAKQRLPRRNTSGGRLGESRRENSCSMPFCIKGTGTKFYGECDHEPDGSFITTEWVVLLYCPFIPFRSVRLRRAPAEDVHVVIFDVEGYEVVARVPLNLAQVLRVYAFVAAALAWWFCVPCFLFIPVFDSKYAMILVFPFFLLMAAPFFGVWWLRRRAARARYRAAANKSMHATADAQVS